MQSVSKAYQESMNSLLRERGYIQVTFKMKDKGIVNNSHLLSQDSSYFSNRNVFDTSGNPNPYITFEEEWVTVDGNMRVLPPKDKSKLYPNLYKLTDTGFVSRDFIKRYYDVIVDFSGISFDIKGIRIDFGDNYPTYFSILNDRGRELNFRNSNRIFETTLSLKKSKKIIIRIYQMKYSNNRVRIFSIDFYQSLSIDNDSTLDSSLSYHQSPIAETLPQVNFSLKITDENNDFYNVRELFDTDTDIEINYGYQLPNSTIIEWLKGATLNGEKYEVEEDSFTVYGWDCLQNLSDIQYAKGIYKSQTVYSLLSDILETAGITNYHIHPGFAQMTITNPLPLVSCKEALQIVANAAQAIFYISRDGTVVFDQEENLNYKAYTKTGTYYSDCKNIVNYSAKTGYIDFGFTTVDGSMKVLPPKKQTKNYPNLYSLAETGYVSEMISNSGGRFSTNPTFIVEMDVPTDFNELIFYFGDYYPTNFTVRAYKGNVLAATVSCDNTNKTGKVVFNFKQITKIEVEFIRTCDPYNRIWLKDIRILKISDVKMNRGNMLSYPVAEITVIKDITVHYYEYQDSVEKKSLYDGVIEVEDNTLEYTFYFNNPISEYFISDGWNIKEQSAYYVTLLSDSVGDVSLKIEGYEYKITDHSVQYQLADQGKSIDWDNPIIGTLTQARNLLEWLTNYYQNNVIYSFSTRGNPELDTGDIMIQEDEKANEIDVVITDATLNFNGAFSGELETKVNI